MRLLAALLTLAALAAPPQEKRVIEEIEETTMGDLDGIGVGMGNMTHMAYTLPDGSEKNGLVCSLAIDGKIGVFVGLGSVITAGTSHWEVVAIEKVRGENGSVTLQRKP